jgi:predicted ferric reductase
MLCMTFRVSSVKQAGARAGTLAMINLTPSFFAFHLSFLADLLGISLSNYRRIHRMTGWMSFFLGVIHALATIHRDPLFLRDIPKNLYAVIVSRWNVPSFENMRLIIPQGGSSLGLLMLLSLPFLRKPSYELFLRSHQALAVLSLYALWQQLRSKSLLVRICLCVSTGMLGLTSCLQLCSILYRNASFRRGFPRARMIKTIGGIKVTVLVPSRLQMKAGQYINLWIPSISFWSFLQSHPFVVASWTEGEQTTLELLIGPQKGLSSKFLRNSTYGSGSALADLCLAVFSGPHGLSAPLAEFEIVLLVASGLGLVAQLPYLQHLIRGYNDFQVCTRRIHLVWQLDSLGKPPRAPLRPTADTDRGRSSSAGFAQPSTQGRHPR